MSFLPLDPLTIRFRGALAEWTAFRATSQDLPWLAADAMTAGWDAPTLAVLAGEVQGPTTTWEVGQLLERAAAELGITPPEHEQAVRELAAYWGWSLVTDRVPVGEAIARMEALPWQEMPGLDEVGAMSAWHDELGTGWGRPASVVEAEIRESASTLVARVFD